MTFTPYNHDDAGHSIEVEDGDVYAEVRGSESYQSGEYTNSRNRTIRVKLPAEEVLAAAAELEESDP
jgi:hypothetical protein